MQYAILTPILGAVRIFLALNNVYVQGNLDFTQAYIYIQIITTASMVLCLWGLFIVYKATHKPLVQFRTTLKFVSIKAIMIIMVIQQLVLSIMVRGGYVETLYCK